MKINVRENSILYIEGPAVVKKLNGTMIIAGAEFESVIIPANKGTSLWFPDGGEVEVMLMEGGSIQGTSMERPRPKGRDEALEEVSDRKTLMVIGPVDVGKSFFTVLAINRLGFDRLLDTDVGQGVISPPTTIGLSRIEGPIPFLSYLIADKMYFVGSTSPKEFMPVFLSGTYRLYSEASGKIVIDTTGRVDGYGARLKVAKAELLGVDGAVIIEPEGMSLDHIKKALKARGIEYVTIPPLEKVTVRSREARREIRKSLYEKRLVNSSERVVPLDIIYGTGRTDEFISKLSERLAENTVGILVGLEKDGLCVGIGYLTEINVEENSAKIFTPVEVFDFVRLGYIVLDLETMQETERSILEGLLRRFSS